MSIDLKKLLSEEDIDKIIDEFFEKNPDYLKELQEASTTKKQISEHEQLIKALRDCGHRERETTLCSEATCGRNFLNTTIDYCESSLLEDAASVIEEFDQYTVWHRWSNTEDRPLPYSFIWGWKPGWVYPTVGYLNNNKEFVNGHDQIISITHWCPCYCPKRPMQDMLNCPPGYNPGFCDDKGAEACRNCWKSYVEETVKTNA